MDSGIQHDMKIRFVGRAALIFVKIYGYKVQYFLILNS